MKNKIKLIILFIFACKITFAQQTETQKAKHPKFNSKEINKALKLAFEKSLNLETSGQQSVKHNPQPTSNTFATLQKMEEIKQLDFSRLAHRVVGAKVLDTVYVGDVPNDTLRIAGTYAHTGPIFVFNDGVLIINNSNFTNDGDIFVFGHGKLFADTVAFTFPQQYFYQRSIVAVQHGNIDFNYCSIYDSGMQHNLVMGDSAVVNYTSIHNYDWTTAGLFGSPTFNIHGCNLGGEYILSGNGHATFNNVDSLLLWHQFPNTAVVNYAFPNGNAVYNYNFNNTIPGISGLNYTVNADSCYNVWWAMMPVNGSDITISNSTLRVIGAWFEHGDSTHVIGVYNNSNYTNFVMPVTDRNLHLINSSVQTWSLYAFDSSKVLISNSTIGEIGTQQRAAIVTDQILLDGSGGYFWATDTSSVIASNSTSYSTVRSEKYGIFIMGYGTMPFTGPTSIANSISVSVQSNIAADPVAYDNANVWLENIAGPATAHADSIVLVTGSAWIDQGPQGGWMFFNSYSLSYQLMGNTSWTYIVTDSTSEIRNNILANWNTNGLAAGTYVLRLVVKSTSLDTVEDFKAITVLPAVTVSINENISDNIQIRTYPNPVSEKINIEIEHANNESLKANIYNVLGEKIFSTCLKSNRESIDLYQLQPGMYFIEAVSNEKRNSIRFVKK